VTCTAVLWVDAHCLLYLVLTIVVAQQGHRVGNAVVIHLAQLIVVDHECLRQLALLSILLTRCHILHLVRLGEHVLVG